MYVMHELQEASTPVKFAEDYSSSESKPIDILIGMNAYHLFMTGETMKMPNSMTVMRTVFGWRLVGEATEGRFQVNTVTHSLEDEDEMIEDRLINQEGIEDN